MWYSSHSRQTKRSASCASTRLLRRAHACEKKLTREGEVSPQILPSIGVAKREALTNKGKFVAARFFLPRASPSPPPSRVFGALGRRAGTSRFHTPQRNLRCVSSSESLGTLFPHTQFLAHRLGARGRGTLRLRRARRPTRGSKPDTPPPRRNSAPGRQTIECVLSL